MKQSNKYRISRKSEGNIDSYKAFWDLWLSTEKNNYETQKTTTRFTLEGNYEEKYSWTEQK